MEADKFREAMTGSGSGAEAPLTGEEYAAMLALLPKAQREDEDGKAFAVLLYEDYVATVAR